MHRTIILTIVSSSLVGSAVAQSNISPNDKYAWGENIGFLNFRDANGGLQGVEILSNHLQGFVWCENVGWLNTGNGGGPYANTDDTNFGVNIEPNGDLTGLAWAENKGWVNFDTRASLTPFGQQARYDAASCRFRGYAWSENTGWINLDDTNVYVGRTLAGDGNGDQSVDIADLNLVLGNFGNMGAPGIPGDINGDGSVNINDLNLVLGNFGQSC